jgi:flagellar basal-body rod modification protein FlgD
MAEATISATTAKYDLSNLNEQSRLPVTTLDQDDFLKLLVTQMTTQDPLKPMEDLSSFSQLASFSALEQNKATQASMAMIQANSMLGHFVQVSDEFGQSMVGQVDQVLMINGEPQLVVDGERFTLDKVSAISALPFAVDDAGDSGGSPSTNTTTPDATATPRLGPAPRLEVDPMLGMVPGLIEAPRTGAPPVVNGDALLGAAPRF